MIPVTKRLSVEDETESLVGAKDDKYDFEKMIEEAMQKAGN